eukprot:1869511-Prorocentrum_lima.AAC.1
MTSSLVGSEMCIRDRFQVAPATMQATEKWLPVGIKKDGGSICMHCKGAVSYTHLTLPTICSV